jgi:hypothetical protein
MRMELSRDVVFIAKHFRIILHNGKKTAWVEEHSLDHKKKNNVKQHKKILKTSLACYYTFVKDNNSTKWSFFFKCQRHRISKFQLSCSRVLCDKI